MEKKDISTVLKLFNIQQQKYKMYYKMSQDDIVHWLMPKEDAVWTYVIENPNEKGKAEVTDFFSMYRLCQSCTSNEFEHHGYEKMYSACLFYYGLTKNNLTDIIKKCLWLSKEHMEADAFSCMTVMDNDMEMLRPLGFMPGDGCLHWYLVNWSLGDNTVEAKDIGTILI